MRCFAVLLALVLGCEGRAASSAEKTEAPRRRGPAVAVVDLSAGVPEEEKSGLFGTSGPKRSFDALVHLLGGLDEAKDDVGVLVKLGSATIGPARAEEIAEALQKIREKKKVYCHADGLGNATLMLAARGCSAIYLSPAGDVDAVGIAAQLVYMRRLLADELHLSIDILQVGKYKGAEEPLTRDGPSPEARQSLTSVLADMRLAWLDDTTRGRDKPGLRDALEDGPYAALRAKDLGLVDEVGYADEALAAAKTASGAVRERVVFGVGAEERGGDIESLVRALAGESGNSGPIALVRATGSISMSSGGGGLLGGRGGIAERDFDHLIRGLEKDDDVKAVVIRIDSPGGSALASDLMWHHLMRLRKRKPLVFSVGDMAASGGYYMASTGDCIFAEPMSIVGSIGVVGGKVAAGEALEAIGVHAETFAANTQKPGAGPRAAYESPLQRWDEPTKARVLESMTGVYELFLARVAEGRSTRGRTMTRAKVAENAEGRIFSGRDGKARGLVDEIGGLAAAIAKARELAKLEPSAEVVVVGTKGGLLDALDPSSPEERALSAVPITILERVAPEAAPFVFGLAPLAEGERAVVAVPYAVTVR